jgi:hypothetical protein
MLVLWSSSNGCGTSLSLFPTRRYFQAKVTLRCIVLTHKLHCSNKHTDLVISSSSQTFGHTKNRLKDIRRMQHITTLALSMPLSEIPEKMNYHMHFTSATRWAGLRSETLAFLS